MNEKTVMMIIPVENGFAFMPNSMDMLVAVGPREAGANPPRVSVARSAEELAHLVLELYAKADLEEAESPALPA